MSRGAPPDERAIVARLREIAAHYPPGGREYQLAMVPRTAFHVRLAASTRRGTAATLCDLGGGTGLFPVGCAALGMTVYSVDDFNDPGDAANGERILELHRAHGVRVVRRDLVNEGIDFPDGSLDVCTSFASIEHWHSSPRRLFQAVRRALVAGGAFILGAPNCVNLRKRLTVPLGHGKWSQMSDWYEAETFRGHVREPDLDDLRTIAHDMGLVNLRQHGRNWMGTQSRYAWVRLLTPLVDRPLRLFPALCAEIYVVGEKPEPDPTAVCRGGE